MREVLCTSSLDSASRLQTHVLKGENNLDAIVADVIVWLAWEDNIHWLLVFDNVDQDHEGGSETRAFDVQQYLPGNHGPIIVTTRLARLAQLARTRDSKLLNKVNEELGKAIFK